ncbi:obg gtpase family [Holotrichia oblita]|nr:obg gtpase family [Holotrichia oblita]
MKLGVVGLPNVGKSTLFNAITKAGAECANYPFCTIEPNVGITAVPDERLSVLGKMYNTKKITPAVIEFVDIAGLVKGASAGEGLGNKFLSHIREVDAIVHVVRCFEDSAITHVENTVDPVRDIETINLELALADLETVRKRREKAEKNIKTGEKKYADEAAVLLKIEAALNEVESELAGMDENERQYFMQELGLNSSGLDEVVSAGYKLLGLISYLTAGEKECRAWTITKGTKAPQAAGKIHTDFEKGFIRAEVVSYAELVKAGSLVAAKEKGKVRSEGKEYVVEDGDVVLFRFNV